MQCRQLQEQDNLMKAMNSAMKENEDPTKALANNLKPFNQPIYKMEQF